jgi:hypothetical protein
MNNHAEDGPTLSAADAAVVDKVLGGDESAAGGAVDAAREARVREWLKVVGTAAAPAAREDLAQRTMEAVSRDRMRVPAAREVDVMPHVRRRWQRRIAEIGAMAVAASIVVAVVVVGLKQSNVSTRRVACAQNLAVVAQGLGAYAADNGGALPMLAMPVSHQWMQSMEAGTARSNAANLLPAVYGKYFTLANLQCAGVTTRRAAGEAEDVVSDYSYTHMYGAGALKPRWNGSPAVIVLTDRNPLFMSGTGPVKVTAEETDRNSPNHGGKGNYLVHADGNVSWETTPNVGGDNLWTVNSGGQRVLMYAGAEMPASGADVFVVP